MEGANSHGLNPRTTLKIILGFGKFWLIVPMQIGLPRGPHPLVISFCWPWTTSLTAQVPFGSIYNTSSVV
jgi:hypothetical protein